MAKLWLFSYKLMHTPLGHKQLSLPALNKLDPCEQAVHDEPWSTCSPDYQSLLLELRREVEQHYQPNSNVRIRISNLERERPLQSSYSHTAQKTALRQVHKFLKLVRSKQTKNLTQNRIKHTIYFNTVVS